MTQQGPVETADAIRNRDAARLAWRFAWVFGLLALGLAVLLWYLGPPWRDAMKNIIASGRKLRAIHIGHWGVWWGCAASAAISAGLALTAPWWARHPASPASSVSFPRPLGGRGWAALIAILLVAGAFRWEHLGLSFYNDEAQCFRRYVAGQNVLQPDGTVTWRPVEWWETIWLNKVANNSMPCSIAGKFSYDLWRKLSGAPVGTVNERAVRFPVMVVAMAGLVVLWALARRLLPESGACWWVLVLATLHPWHMRYSSEGRGHGFLLLTVPLCFWFLKRALDDDRWRWWIGMGLAQFGCVWAFQGSAGFLVSFNALLLLAMLWQVWRRKYPASRVIRPLLGMAVGALVTLPVMLPLMQQLEEAIRTLDSLKGHMGLGWWKDVASLLSTGLVWVDQNFSNPTNLALDHFVRLHWWLWLLAPFILVPITAGAARALRCGITGLLAVLAGPLAAVCMVTILSSRGTFLFPWYLIFMLPGFLVVWGIGIATLMARASAPALRAAAGAALALPFLGLLWANAQTMEAPKENLRGLARAVPEGDLHGSLFSDVDVYDHDVRVLSGMASLDALVAEARAASKPLYVSFSRRNHSEEFEAFYRRLEQGGEFQHVADFPGQQEDQFTHHLYRLRQ